MRTKLPTLCRRARESGRVDAIVTLCAYGTGRTKQYYCGPWNSAAARRTYHNLTDQWEKTGRRVLPDDPPPLEKARPANTTIAELVDHYFTHIQKTARRPGEYKPILRALCEYYEDLDVTEFGPLKLRELRVKLITEAIQRTKGRKFDKVIARQTANRYARAVVSIFKWGASFELVPSAHVVALSMVLPLKIGETDAPETKKVRPVSDGDIEATVRHATPVVAAMIKLQRATGMRSGELVRMRAIDIDTSNPKCWAYQPAQHKTLHRGLSRIVYLGAKAQGIIRPFLTSDAAAFLFRPDESANWRLARRTEARKTPLSCGNVAGENRAEQPARPPGECYTPGSYRKAIKYAIARAEREARENAAAQGVEIAADTRFIPDWHPHQLRHALITELRAGGVDKQTVAEFVGHHDLKMTDRYTDGMRLARKLAEDVG